MPRRLKRLIQRPFQAIDGEPPAAARPRVGFVLYAGHVLTVFGIALSNMFMGLMVLWAIWQRRRLSWDWLSRMSLFVPAGVYFVFFMGSIAASLDPTISLGEMRDVLSFATLFLAPALVRGPDRVRCLCDGLIVLGVAVSLHGLGQFYFTDYGELHRRIVGPFSHVQTFSGILLILMLVTVARLTRDGKRNRWLWLALALIVWTQLLTLTRGAWVAGVVALAGVGLVRAGRRFPVYATATAVVLALMVASAPRQAAERILSIVDLQDSSNYDRLCMTEAAIFMVQESPLFGIGPEMVKHRYPIYRHPTAPKVQVPHLHSTFVQRAAEQGLLGLGAYLWLTLAALYLAWQGLRHGGADTADLHLAALLVIIGFNIAGLFEDNWRDTEVRRLLLFFFALPLSLTGPSSKEPSRDPA
jgi:O-antigen ligase